jgi:hypothetical protein
VLSDTHGIMRFSGLRPGHYTLRSDATGYVSRIDTLIIGTIPPPALEFPLTLDPSMWPAVEHPVTGELVVRLLSGIKGEPLGGARALLHCCLGQERALDSLAITDSSGKLQFRALRPGRYVLRSVAIGYAGRHDTLVIGAVPPRLEMTLKPAPMCLGSCPPDPRMVAAARARRKEWGCARDAKLIEEVRQHWVGGRLATDSVVRIKLGVRADREEIAAALQHVTDPEVCRRAAQYFDRSGTISTLDFLVSGSESGSL